MQLRTKTIRNFFLIFLGSFLAMILLFSFPKVSQIHHNVCCKIGQPIFNILNPHVYAEFIPTAPENEEGWGMTFKIWDVRNIRQGKPAPQLPPKGILYQSPHELFLIPTLFLIALFLATPLNWKTKLMRFFLGLLMFYLVMILYLSWRFEFTLNKQALPIDSIWHAILWFFGLGGTTDPIYIVVFFIWAILIIPKWIMKQGSVGLT